MARLLYVAGLLAIFSAAGWTQEKNSPKTQSNSPPAAPNASASPSQTQKQQPPDETDLPEEDESLKPRVYAFDPMASERSIRIGNFYMHKGTPSGYRAALGRYEDATKYNPTSAEAFFHVGEVEEKLKNKDAARLAFQKVVQLAPDSKLANEAKKKLKGT